MNLAEVFERQVEKTPDAVAVVFENESLSYGELNRRANQLAHHLIHLGVRPESAVGVCMDRSLDAVAAMLAIFKAGGLYVPLDPGLPEKRTVGIVEDARIAFCFVDHDARNALLRYPVHLLLMDDTESAARTFSKANPERTLASSNSAYAIYTSGSTGQPKGVIVEHRQIVSYIESATRRLDGMDGLRFAILQSFAFDFVLTGLLCTLCKGGSVHVIPEYISTDPLALSRHFSVHKIECGKFAPSHFAALQTDSSWSDIIPSKYLIFGGESSPLEWVREIRNLRPECKIFNHYGPTETTVGVMMYQVEGTERGCSNLPIGRPIANTRVYVLDERLEPVPVGVAGELYIAGAQLARGYLNRPGLTAERFIADPYGEPGARMYRTGDLGRWLPDGNLEFLGRTDHQVKIRGYRIELGEIESALRKLSGVADAAVLAREDDPGEKRLVGYVVLQPGQGEEGSQLREQLKAVLPEYMVPSAVVVLDAFPLTANGKLDRKALPAPEYLSCQGYRAPRTPQEEVLCGIFAEVLGVERVGLDDNFFDLGGHSLLAVSVLSRVRAVLGIDLSLDAIFESRTVDELAGHLESTSGEARGSLCVQTRPAELPLSYGQQRLWFLHQMDKTSVEYNVSQALRLVGELDRAALERAINTMVERHESLRTRFEERGGSAVQVISPSLPIMLVAEDLSLLPESQRQSGMAEAIRQERLKPFDLEHGPVLRVRLLKLAAQEHVLLRSMHHIVSDAWSQAVFNRELKVLYDAYSAGRPNPLPALKVQYADFTLWQRQWLDNGALQQGLAYWRDQLDGIPEYLQLPSDRPRPAVQTFVADLRTMAVPGEIVTALKRAGSSHGTTPYMTLLAAFAVLLSRYSGQQDIVVGSAIANRQDSQLEDLIGFFVNSLVMRIRVNPGASFSQVLEQVRQTALDAYQHQDVPFERLVEELSPQRSLSWSPLFQVVFDMQNAPREEYEFRGLQLQAIREDELRVRFDLEVHVREQDGEFSISWLYNRDLFDGWRIEQMAGHYLRVLQALAADTGTRIDQLDILAPAERRKILQEWNETKVELPADKCIHQLFEEQVEKTPDAVAVVFENESLSYGELNRRANQLAHHLIHLGVGPEDIVGMALPRSIEMIVSLLAILKAGAAYLPLDLNYPAERLRYMLEDTGAQFVVAQQPLPGSPQETIQWVLPKDIAELPLAPVPNPTNSNRRIPLHPMHPAYVIYTSGSTGTPKGVVVCHASLSNYAYWAGRSYEIYEGMVIPINTSITFDATVTSLYLPLLSGGQVFILPEDNCLSCLCEEIRSGRSVGLIKLTPAHLNFITETLVSYVDHSTVERMIVGGETLHTSSVAAWRQISPHTILVNEYGPTEATVGCSIYVLQENHHQSGEAIPIGRPVANTRVYVLDERLEPVPVGVAGELYIAGVQLARGYLNRPGLTAERFIADPYGEPGARMYRTGDLGRWLPDGNLEFLGRTDHQVKIRGYRIELGEIESALRKLSGVADAAVLAREDDPGEKRLVGYVVLQPGQGEEGSQLREQLKAVLPEYMVPSAVVVLDAFPLTANGKLDRKALPAPEYLSRQGYRAPRTPQEEILCGIFAEVLGVERVGLNDNFFDLGGHSLLATRLITRVRAVFGTEINIRALFVSPTVDELAGRLESTSGEARGSLCVQTRPAELPLSYGQQRLWFLHQMDKASVEYNVSQALRLVGELDRAALERAINTMVERHESLRTRFEERGGSAVQVISPSLPIMLVAEDLSSLPESQRQSGMAEAIRQERLKPFDLEHGPVLRVRLLKLAAQEHVLLRSMHHIVSDAWSQAVFNRELKVLYDAYSAGRPNPLPALKVQYADFTLWQRQWLDNGALQQGLAYWRDQLDGIPEYLQLPSDRPRPAVRSSKGAFYQTVLGATLTAALKRAGSSHGTTPYMTLLAAFAVLLSRYSGQQDIVVGSAIANRQDSQLEDLIGFFVNSLVMRIRVNPGASFSQVLEQVRQTALDAYQHQDVPFERLVEELSPQRSLSWSPLFQVVFDMQNAPREEYQLRGLQLQAIRGDELSVRFDLRLDAIQQGDNLALSWLYNRDLFDSWRIEQMAGHYLRVLQALAADTDTRIDQLDILAPAERRKILQEWNETKVELPADKCIHQLFEEQVEKTPDAVAVVFENESLSYGELNRRANQLAHHLIHLGVRPESAVGVCMDRSLDAVAAMLAIFKAGGLYVPLDPGLPEKRTVGIVEDARIAFCFVDHDARNALLRYPVHLLLMDDTESAARTFSKANPERTLASSNSAYAIYTSGSTGQPKGVIVEHRQIVSYIESATRRLDGMDGLRFAILQSFAFDFVLTGLLCTLCKGGSVHVIPEYISTDPLALSRHFSVHKIECGKFAPSHFAALQTDSSWSDIIPSKYLIFGGESSPLEWVREIRNLRPECKIFNHYGPTETTVGVMMYQVEGTERGCSSLPIGRPIANTRVYVLDERLEPVPVGVAGELYIAGAQLARGYLNRPGLTAERFIADPYGEPGARMYRTGDLGRWLPDGNLEFLGRTDHQVKIRGYRIELGEIESALRKLSGVADAAVLAREDDPGEKRLVGYVVLQPGQGEEGSQLREQLKAVLPEYMVPSAVVVLDAFPLTANGKLDRKALPAPEYLSRQGYRAPRTPQEEILCGIFAEVLGVERVGLDDNFFDLGGHSLLATRLITRIHARLQIQVTIRSLFECPTPRSLAGASGLDPYAPVLYLRKGESPPCLFFLPPLGFSWLYAGLAKYIPSEYQMVGLQDPSLSDPHFFLTFWPLAEYFKEQITLIQPSGPYYLLGYSFGGLLAYATACLLDDRSSDSHVFILDSYPPLQNHQQAASDSESLSTQATDLATRRAEYLNNIRQVFSDIVGTRMVERVIPIAIKNREASVSVSFPTTNCRLTMVRSTTRTVHRRVPSEWQKYSTVPIAVLDVPFRHEDLCTPESFSIIGPYLASVLLNAHAAHHLRPQSAFIGDIEEIHEEESV